ncbi:hypothetical protein HBI56_206250 [Parastagonospora nodorum]|nr:hypothetical protein HBH53_205060 [Parastagonospora nodorum]KAH3961430.1 hypothetical protein HBH52_231470 [Parastagonospora nodorum]KAH3991924.1 hypothetical protein HBI10_223350 [Parastagonospora nodorum]KAH4009866.1 hypothetical protein HBI13_216090 [Parastagonospora nodorum]KAH4016860.1 hypothetical protein HBI09_201120 [Parastagonospora nodorum]
MNRMQHNADGCRQQPVGGPVGMLVRGIAAGIGLASESYQHHKEKKSTQTREVRDDENDIAVTREGRESQQDACISQQMDEAAWELDEAQDDQVPENRSRPAAATDEDVTGLANSFLVAHARPHPYSLGQLALPVVITQRRPESRTKGFIRAYSPLLEDVNIDQATFLDFLGNLNKSLAPSPWIQAINLAAFAGQKIPEPFTIMISIAVKKVADAASELHSRSKTNRFLDQVNEDFFAPRGLVALIMTWKPSQKDAVLTRAEFDMQSSIAKASDARKSRRLFESSSGATSFEWPQTAPLVFPALDELEGEKEAAVKRSGKYVAEYMDRRARAKWAGENPESALANATRKEKFSSRYADPNHPASSGDPIALLTGGFIQAGLGRQMGNDNSRGGLFGGSRDHEGAMGLGRGRMDGWQRGGESSRGAGRIGPSGGGRGGIAGSSVGPLTLVEDAKKLFQDDVLYLMIVQRPTDEQMAAAMQRIGSLGQTRH